MKIIDAWTLLYFIHSLEPVLGHTVNNSNNNNFLCDWLLTMEVNFTHEFRNVRTWGEISTNSNLKYKSPPPGHLNEWDREEAEVVDSFDWSWFGWTLDISTDMSFHCRKLQYYSLSEFPTLQVKTLNMTLLIVYCGNHSILFKCLQQKFINENHIQYNERENWGKIWIYLFGEWIVAFRNVSEHSSSETKISGLLVTNY